MNNKTSDNILYIILMFVGVGIYTLCVYLSFAFLRIGMLCNELGGIYSLGAILGVVAFILPLICVYLLVEKYIPKRKHNKVWMFIICAVAIVSFVAYCIFVDRSLITGRDITMDLFLALELLIVPIVGAVRVHRNQ